MSKQALKQFEAWHNTKGGLIVFAALELAIAYLLGSRAIDTGSWWEYALTIVLLIGVAQNLIRLIRKK